MKFLIVQFFQMMIFLSFSTHPTMITSSFSIVVKMKLFNKSFTQAKKELNSITGAEAQFLLLFFFAITFF